MGNYKKPLQRSIILGCMMFITLLSLMLGIVTYFEYRHAMYARYDAYIRDLLVYTSSILDVDDMQKCLETGEKSELFLETQDRIDQIKDTHDIHFLYVIIPLNTTGNDNIMNVIAAMSQIEKATMPEHEVVLGGLTGDAYSAETAAKYYNVINNTGEISFFEETAVWGTDYTGVLPLVNSKGEFFAELCVDASVNAIYSTIGRFTVANIVLILLLAGLYILLFVTWSSCNIVQPIKKLEGSVVNFARKSHHQRSLSELTLEIPDIHTDNEVESLANAISKMADDMKDYVSDVIEAEREAERMKIQAINMSELANKDALTGIRNMTAYEKEVDMLEAEMKETPVEFGVVMIDLNWLKYINDTYGHGKGNIAIQTLCQLVCDTFPQSPVFRIGGDEFVVIVRGEDYQDIQAREKEFYQRLENLGTDDKQQPWERISASLGYALYDSNTDACYADVFARADKAMYENKSRMHGMREKFSA